MIQYAEQGRIAELSALFSSLNVALGSMDFDEARGGERLMTVQDRARSVAALTAAPPVVAQIAEDVLAQTSAAHASLLGNPLTRRWQAQVYPLCHGTVTGRYPFGDGPDAELADFAALFGPGGALARFVGGEAARYLDTSERPWRWKPEARLSGLTPESAAFLEMATAIGGAFFGDAGLGATMELAALAEKGEATMLLGGAGAPIRATGAAERLVWPGPDPEAGAEVAFREGAASSRIAEPGAWGLFRLLERTPVRARDDGARMLLDIRDDTGRLFLEMRFDEPANPVSARRLLSGLVCPPVL
jgi:type VI protein secretion system component VasK